MDKQRLEWLAGEVKSWLQAGVIDQQSANSILNRYQIQSDGDSGTSWSSVILASLGALLIGGGIILLFAHNWDELGKSSRTVLSFLPLLIAQGLAFYAYKYRPDSKGWLESSSILVFLAIGSSISLIGQTYHIYGNLERFFVTWLVLAIPLLYLMHSKAVFILCNFLIITLCAVGSDWHWLWYIALAPSWILMYRQPQHWGFYWVTWVSAISLFICWMIALDYRYSWMIQNLFLIALMFGVIYYLGGKLLFGFDNKSFWENAFSNFGALIIVFCCLALSWEDTWDTWRWSSYSIKGDFSSLDYFYFCLTLAIILGSIYCIIRYRSLLSISSKLLIASLLFLPLHFIARTTGMDGSSLWVFMNLYVLLTSVSIIFEGVNSHRLKVLNAGLVWLSLLIMFRFFDSDISFIGKGIAFILVGTLFIVANLWFKKQNQKSQEKLEGESHEA